MKLLLDILQGAGLATSTGLRPFLPALAAGALASQDAGLDFERTDFSFLEDPWFLLLLAACLVVSVLARGLLAEGPGAAMLTGIGAGLGALLFAGSLADRHATWWYGLIAGAVIALFAASVSGELIGRVRRRFEAQGDRSAAAALSIYLEGAAVVTALASILAPPLALVALAFLVALFTRRGDKGKFAGLRILR